MPTVGILIHAYKTCNVVEPLYKVTLKYGHVFHQDIVTGPSYNTCVYKATLKCGHLTNQDTLGCPKGVCIERFHYIILS